MLLVGGRVVYGYFMNYALLLVMKKKLDHKTKSRQAMLLVGGRVAAMYYTSYAFLLVVSW